MPLVKSSSPEAFTKNLKAEIHAGKPMKQSLAIAYSMKRKAKKMSSGGQIKDNYQSSAHSGDLTHPDLRDHEGDSGFLGHEGNTQRPSSAAVMEAAKRLNQQMVMARAGDPKEHQVDDEMDELSPDFSGLDRLADGGVVDQDQKNRSEEEMTAHLMGGDPAGMLSDDEKMAADPNYAKHPTGPDTHYRTGNFADGGLIDRILSKRKKMSEGGRVANATPITAGFSPNEFDDLVLRDDLHSTYGQDDNAGDSLGNAREDQDRHDIVKRIMKKRSDRLPRPA
jgi:hypothetical protein